jgi:hypothetical protein
MTLNSFSTRNYFRQCRHAALFAAAGAAIIGLAGSPAARADDGASITEIGLSAASAGNQYDPAVFDYSANPSNLFAPVYTITPTGPEDVEVTTTATGTVYGTQDFTLSSLGFPADTFNGSVEYAPMSGLGGELGGYSETITTLGTPGTLLPEPTGFLVDEFGLGYGNVFEESMNTAGTSATVGDFILTPFGDENITPILALLFPEGIGYTDAAGTLDPSAFGDLLTSIGL